MRKERRVAKNWRARRSALRNDWIAYEQRKREVALTSAMIERRSAVATRMMSAPGAKSVPASESQ